MMTVGMLWMDADPKSEFDAKLRKAFAYYEKKYGVKPTDCFVNLDQKPENDELDGIKLRGAKNILIHHFWIGIDGQAPKPIAS